MNNLFLGISTNNKIKVLKMLEGMNVKFTKGIDIIDYMNRKNSIGIITKGSLEIISTDYNGTTSLIDELSTNDIFGSMIDPTLLSEECSIITKEECEITFIDYNNITNKEIIKYDYYIVFIQNLLKIISEQILLKNERIQILVKKSIRDRLLTYFKIQEKKQGTKNLLLPTSLSALSNYLAIDRSAMMREIKNLNLDGIINSKGRKIRLNF